jgi:hypothetical protein
MAAGHGRDALNAGWLRLGLRPERDDDFGRDRCGRRYRSAVRGRILHCEAAIILYILLFMMRLGAAGALSLVASRCPTN